MEIRNIIHIAIELWGSIFCILAAICMVVGKEDKYRKHKTVVKLLICACLLGLGDAMAWFYRGNESEVGYYMVRVSNYVVFVFFYLYGLLASDFLLYCLVDDKATIKKRPTWNIVVRCISILGIWMFTVNVFHPWLYDFDATNHYYRLEWFTISQVIGIVASLIFLFVVFGNIRKLSDEDTISSLSLAVLPVIALIITIAVYGISLTYMSMMGAVMVCFVAYAIERAKINDQKNYELRERETALMMSQVSPHFIYNSLAAIRAQVVDDPDAAYDTIGEFATYLRANLNTKQLEGTISLADELEHVMVYVNLEKLRLGDKLLVECAVENEEIQVPAMCVQTMVENAIKHGIKPKGEGNVWITEHEEQNVYIIYIKDNGVGFDVESATDDGKVHIGMHSVEERVRYMCGGTVEFKSEIGSGTEVKIIIPKKGE